MIIGVDVDGVLTDVRSFQLTEGEKYFKYPPLDMNGYSISDMYGVDHEKDRAFWAANVFRYAAIDNAMPGAAEAIKKLREDGDKIYIVTARSYTTEDSEKGERMRAMLSKWLFEHDIGYDKIIYSPEDKAEICRKSGVQVMVEDYTFNILNVAKYVPAICFDAVYNRDAAGNNVYRCRGWAEVYETIKKLRR